MAQSKTELFEREFAENARYFKALAHPARLQILKFLADSDSCITGDISDELPLGRTTVNQHIKELKQVGLIVGHTEGVTTKYCLNPNGVAKLKTMLSLFVDNLDRQAYCCDEVLTTKKYNSMLLEIFEPALCCDSGVCGPAPDKSMFDLQHTLNVVKEAGCEVKRYAINKAPAVFVQNKVVSEFIRKKGVDKLPLVLLDGEVILTGKYPGFKDLEQYIPALKGMDKKINIVGLYKA